MLRAPGLLVALATLALGAGCGAGGGDGASGHPLEAVVEGLEAAGPGPTFTWEAYDGAALYRVLVAPEDDGGQPWVWIGPETTVAYGQTALPPLEDDADPVDFTREALADLTGLAAVQEASYRWTVTALDSEARALGTSEVATFKCTSPCGD